MLFTSPSFPSLPLLKILCFMSRPATRPLLHLKCTLILIIRVLHSLVLCLSSIHSSLPLLSVSRCVFFTYPSLSVFLFQCALCVSRPGIWPLRLLSVKAPRVCCCCTIYLDKITLRRTPTWKRKMFFFLCLPTRLGNAAADISQRSEGYLQLKHMHLFTLMCLCMCVCRLDGWMED